MNDLPEITYEELENIDVISVELVPERKGLILKHCEYYVSSRRHGTTVNRRYNDFVQLYDVLSAKYPYRAISRLPPKHVVVNGGSPMFLERRRADLECWLTLVARHPVIAHDADLRAFLCETTVKLEKPKHDEFVLAGTRETNNNDNIQSMQAKLESEYEQLHRVQLALERLCEVFEKVDVRMESERVELSELGSGFTALSTPSPTDDQSWRDIRESMKKAASLCGSVNDADSSVTTVRAAASWRRVRGACRTLSATRALQTRLTRGLHAERHAAAAAPALTAAAAPLRARLRYTLDTQLEEVRIGQAYALAGVRALPELMGAYAETQMTHADTWKQLYRSIDNNTHCK